MKPFPVPIVLFATYSTSNLLDDKTDITTCRLKLASLHLPFASSFVEF